jgi:hypothetical protein
MRTNAGSPSTTARAVLGLAALLLLGGVAGCGASDSPASGPGGSGSGSGAGPGSGSGASCVAAIRYDGHLYLMWRRLPGRGPEPTGRTLPAGLPACNDVGPGGRQEPDQPIRVDVLRATDPRVAVGYRGDLYVREGASPPAGPRWMPHAPS